MSASASLTAALATQVHTDSGTAGVAPVQAFTQSASVLYASVSPGVAVGAGSGAAAGAGAGVGAAAGAAAGAGSVLAPGASHPASAMAPTANMVRRAVLIPSPPSSCMSLVLVRQSTIDRGGSQTARVQNQRDFNRCPRASLPQSSISTASSPRPRRVMNSHGVMLRCSSVFP